jgi:predicted transcriptional regulator
MNKIKYVTLGNYEELWKNEEALKDLNDFNPTIEVDKMLMNIYGLKCLQYFGYHVIDESKFVLFLLKYPECIEKISYE